MGHGAKLNPACTIVALAVMAISPSGASALPRLDAVLAGWDGDEHPDLRGVVVLHKGRRVAERYYNGASASALHDIRSAGKSVTALMAGIAMDRGAIRSVDDPVDSYWTAAQGSAVGSVALRDILTMRSGLAAIDADPASPGHEDRMDEAADPLAFVRALPRIEQPGAHYRYNSTTAYVAGVVVAKATGQPMRIFAGRRLFRPLGITRWRWDDDAAGMTKGQGNLWLTARGLADIGEMVRNGGRVGRRRIVSPQWIAAMLAPRVPIASEDPFADHYAYFWYSKTQPVGDAMIRVSFASGNGGNKIYVASGCDLVVAIASAAYGRGYGQRRSETILNAILAAENAAGACRPDTPDDAREGRARDLSTRAR